MRNAAKQGCLAISLDLWTDKFKQNSYLGLTAHFIDEHYVLHSTDLCCEPYNEINKRGDNVLKVEINVESKILFMFVFHYSSLSHLIGNHCCSFSF